MERKEFLKASLWLGALGGVAPALGEEAKPAASAVPPPPSPCERKAEFAQRLLVRFMSDMDSQLDEPRRVALMEARGRSCARMGAVRAAQAHKGNLDAFIADFGRHMEADGLRREGNVVKVKYPRCLCPLASGIQEPISPTYCNCSVGWLKELYETVTGKPVTVEVLETVKRGGQACRFNVTLSA
jgi:predicted hydrocarbon binding protein